MNTCDAHPFELQMAYVDRVVGDSLLFVHSEQGMTYAFRPETIRILEGMPSFNKPSFELNGLGFDPKVSRYRGEWFKELGLRPGRRVWLRPGEETPSYVWIRRPSRSILRMLDFLKGTNP